MRSLTWIFMYSACKTYAPKIQSERATTKKNRAKQHFHSGNCRSLSFSGCFFYPLFCLNQSFSCNVCLIQWMKWLLTKTSFHGGKEIFPSFSSLFFSMLSCENNAEKCGRLFFFSLCIRMKRHLSSDKRYKNRMLSTWYRNRLVVSISIKLCVWFVRGPYADPIYHIRATITINLRPK